MMNQPSDPHQRKAVSVFNASHAAEDDKTRPYGQNVPSTLPFGKPHNPAGVSEDSPTMPMPVSGMTEPLVPGPPHPKPQPSIPGQNYKRETLGPVAGWLVIVSGPGRGRSLELGYGYNSIGRNISNEVCLPYQDLTISDMGHAFIAYDNLGHKSYVTHGHGRNMIYLNNTPVLGTVEINAGDSLRIGNTVLVFVPFCSAERNWDTFPETVK